MKKFLITAVISCLSCYAMAANVSGAHGSADTATPNTRVVVIQAATKYVNVSQGETVKFVIHGKSFAWHFDTLRGQGAVLLSEIAPEGVDIDKIWVYVAPDPLYHGG